MTNQELLDYIRQQLTSGVSKEDIGNALLSSNWSVKDVNDAFSFVEKTPLPLDPSSPITFLSPTGVAQTDTISEEKASKPSNVRFFEILMYISIIVSAVTPFLQYEQYRIAAGLFVLFIPLILVVGRLTLVFLAAHRRMNWARIILLVLFLGHFMGLLGIVVAFFSHPILALLSLAPILLEAAAFGFAFSRSANRWFDPMNSAMIETLGDGIENTVWSKGIPRTNKGFMIVSLVLVFGIDLLILMSSPELAPFYIEMLVVLIIFGIFFYRENYILNKRFATSRSKLDTWLTSLIVIRNIVFVLNFIPFIQIGGAMALAFGGIPYLIGYFILLSKRSKIT